MKYSIGDIVKFKIGSIETDKGEVSLGSREERVALLKAGFTGKDIESEYLRRNRIVIIGINWQDLKSK